MVLEWFQERKKSEVREESERGLLRERFPVCCIAVEVRS